MKISLRAISLAFACASLLFACSGKGTEPEVECANSGHAHRLDGSTVEYAYLDSVVTVFFADTIMPDSARSFALGQPGLRDDYTPWMIVDRLWVFGVEAAVNMCALMDRLRQASPTSIVNPVLNGFGDVPVYMADMLIVAFLPEANQTAVDSLNRALAAQVSPADSHDENRFVVRIRADLRLNALEVADLYYHSGLCRYAEPNYISSLIPD